MNQVFTSHQDQKDQNQDQDKDQKPSSSLTNMQTGRSPTGPPPIKEEHGDPPPGTQYLSARCVLFTYFHGDISREVDEHFSRALSTGTNLKTLPRDADGSFPMNQRSFPPSFWSSSFTPCLSHTELSFPYDAFSSSTLHSHNARDHHHYSLGGAIGTQSSAYPRSAMHDMYGTAFDPRYGSLLVPSVRSHHRLAASSCDLSGKAESGTVWNSAFAGTDINLTGDSGVQTQEKSKDLYWF